jgi:23S rRNA (cytidine1920-2'-O)/16S rRNA (cytidine1409-2'-O)-methyltransferase
LSGRAGEIEQCRADRIEQRAEGIEVEKSEKIPVLLNCIPYALYCILTMKERADVVLVKRGLAESRHKAQALIMAGLVFVEGVRVEKSGQKIEEDSLLSLAEKMPYVGRGGLKLEEALKCFGISVDQKVAADLGASTGGFIHCLLNHGARRVYAVDVDIRQLDWSFRENSRVVCIERNARYLKPEDFGEPLDIVTVDLSFISIVKILPAVRQFLDRGLLLTLIKPQFEVGRRQVGKKGIVKNPALHEEVLVRITSDAEALGFRLRSVLKSSTPGAKGNREYFLCWDRFGDSLPLDRQQKLIKEAVWDEKN